MYEGERKEDKREDGKRGECVGGKSGGRWKSDDERERKKSETRGWRRGKGGRMHRE